MKLALLLLDGSKRRFPLQEGEEALVGSGVTAALRLAAPDVSRSHALVCSKGGKVRVVDLGSKNGTYVGGRRITEAELSVGEVVFFSTVGMQVVVVEEEPEEVSGWEPVPQRAGDSTSQKPLPTTDGPLRALLRKWDWDPAHALETFLHWVVEDRHLAGAGVVEWVGGEVVVMGWQGLWPKEVVWSQQVREFLSPGAAPTGGSVVVRLSVPGQELLGMPLRQGLGLLLILGERMPEQEELVLLAQAARLGLRLAKTGADEPK